MWIIQLLLSWALLYVVFRWLLFGGKDNNQKANSDHTRTKASKSSYFSDDPDILKPDIEPDEFDPSDYF